MTQNNSTDDLICDSCHTPAEESDTVCWVCGCMTFVYEPENAKPPQPQPSTDTTPAEKAFAVLKRNINIYDMKDLIVLLEDYVEIQVQKYMENGL